MRIDLHTHAKWSKKADFSLDYFSNMMKEARKSQLDAIALTEHFNTYRFDHIYETLDRQYPYEGNYYIVEGVKVFPGIEVDVMEKGHILLIGTRKSIINVHSRLKLHMEEKNYMDAKRLIGLSEEYSCVSIGAHPLRELNPLIHLEQEVLSRLDAFDLNGRDLHHYGRGMEEKVTSFAELIGLPIVAGSDTHQPLQFGSVYNHFEQSLDSVDQLRDAIRAGTYEYRISEQLHSKVCLAEAEQDRYKKDMAWS